MGLSAGERETTINYDDEGDTAYVITYSRPMLTSLRKNDAAVEVTSPVVAGLRGGEFRVPKQLVSIRRPRTGGKITSMPRRPMTQEHKDKLAAGRLAAKEAKVNA